jgi:TonB family protein
MRTGILIVAFCVVIPLLQAEQQSSPRSGSIANINEVKALAINTPRPDYPFEARSRHLTGTGLAILDVDPTTGSVTTARIAVSTGHQILDDATLNAFRRWRFKPGTVKKVKIPITFSMGTGRFALPPKRKSAPLPNSQPAAVHSVSGGRDAIAIYKPALDYPAIARLRHVTGSGVAIVEIDAKTGTVIGARMNPSTGHPDLDSAALNSFRKWRFKPGTGGKFKIPVTYTMAL